MKPSVLMFAVLLAPAPAFAAAPNFQYDYLDLGHARVQPQGSSTGSGPFADLSCSIIDTVQIRGSYSTLSYPLGVKYNDYSLGLTGEDRITDSTDVYTDLLYINDRYDHLGTYVSDNGYRLAIGLRHHPWNWDRLEFDGYLAHNFIGATIGRGAGSQSFYLPQSSNEVGVGAMFDATSWLSLGLVVARDSTQTEITTLKLRLYF